jgi:hypothetical protein
MEPKKQVVIEEDDALMTAPAICGNLKCFLESYVNDLSHNQDNRKIALLLSRCLKIKDV